MLPLSKISTHNIEESTKLLSYAPAGVTGSKEFDQHKHS